jgi:hypothetical protein
MWVKALSKHKFGEQKEPYVNIDQIVSVELGHGQNLNVRLSNGDEMVVSNAHAERLLQFIQEQSISDVSLAPTGVSAAPAIH